MKYQTWLGAFSVVATTGIGFGIGACSDSKVDGQASTSDAGSRVDGSVDKPPVVPTDGGVEAPDSGDAAVAITITTETTTSARLVIDETSVVGTFTVDDFVIRYGDICSAIVKNVGKGFSGAGKLQLGGDFVGAVGGLPSVIDVPIDVDKSYASFLADGQFFEPGSGSRLQIESAGAPGVVALPATTLRVAPFKQVTILSPKRPDAGGLVIKSTEDWKVEWTPPALSGDAGSSAAQVILELSGFSTEAVEARVLCGFPVRAGAGVVPRSLLAAFKAKLGVAGAIPDGRMNLSAGDLKQVSVTNGRYFVLAAGFESASYSDDAVTLE